MATIMDKIGLGSKKREDSKVEADIIEAAIAKSSQVGNALKAHIEGAKKHGAESDEFDSRGADKGSYQERSMDEIMPDPYQYRFSHRSKKGDKDIEKLSQSLKDEGLLQPILLYRLNNEDKEFYKTCDNYNDKIKFLIVAGEQRFLAAQKADFKTIPSFRTKYKDRTELKRAGAIENTQRKNLDTIEEAFMVADLLDDKNPSGKPLCKDFNAVSRLTGFPRAKVSQLLRLSEINSVVVKKIADEKTKIIDYFESPSILNAIGITSDAEALNNWALLYGISKTSARNLIKDYVSLIPDDTFKDWCEKHFASWIKADRTKENMPLIDYLIDIGMIEELEGKGKDIVPKNDLQRKYMELDNARLDVAHNFRTKVSTKKSEIRGRVVSKSDTAKNLESDSRLESEKKTSKPKKGNKHSNQKPAPTVFVPMAIEAQIVLDQEVLIITTEQGKKIRFSKGPLVALLNKLNP